MSVDPAINAALLNMCAQVQDSGNNSSSNTNTANTAAVAATPSAASTRPASDYEWLRGALASVESPEKRIKQLLFHMEGKTADGQERPIEVEERMDAVEELSDMVEDVNWAAEFTLMQGPQRVLRVLCDERKMHPLTNVPDSIASAEGEDTTAVTAAASQEGSEGSAVAATTYASVPLITQLAMIIAHSAQLNEPVQAVYQHAHWEKVLLRLIADTIAALRTTAHKEPAGDKAAAATKLLKLLAALLHACSCLCRECLPNAIQFIQHGGLAVVAEVLQLTLSLTSTDPTPSTEVEAAPAVTTIHAESAGGTEGEQNDGEESRESSSALTSSANKVTARVFFFAGYLASTGVSSEDMIQLICQHAEANADAQVQKAAACALLELLAKSPKAIKEAVHAYMPKRFYEWKQELQHVAGGGEEEENHKDERQRFVEALDGSN